MSPETSFSGSGHFNSSIHHRVGLPNEEPQLDEQVQRSVKLIIREVFNELVATAHINYKAVVPDAPNLDKAVQVVFNSVISELADLTNEDVLRKKVEEIVSLGMGSHGRCYKNSSDEKAVK